MMGRKLRTRHGYVYVFGGDGTYKIGWATNPETRIALWPLMPWPCSLVHIIESKDAQVLESQLHKMFADKRLHGEWFALSDEELNSIPERAEDIEPLLKKHSPKRRGIVVVFSVYLEDLYIEESKKPLSERRSVPTLKEVALAVGVHEVTLNRILNGHVSLLNTSTMKAVLDDMWHRGFEPLLTDFIRYEPPTVERQQREGDA